MERDLLKKFKRQNLGSANNSIGSSYGSPFSEEKRLQM